MQTCGAYLESSAFWEACHLVEGRDQVWQLLRLPGIEAAQIGQALLHRVIQLEEQQELVRGPLVQGPPLCRGHLQVEAQV